MQQESPPKEPPPNHHLLPHSPQFPQHTTILHSRRALQHSIRTDDGPWHFHAFNTELNFQHKYLERQRSPIYIGVRRKAPVIVEGLPK